MTVSQPPRAAERLLAGENDWAREACKVSNVAWWEAGCTGDPVAYARLEEAEKALNEHYARVEPYRQLTSLLEGHGLDPLTRRRLERLAFAYRARQAPRELIDRITTAATALEERYSTFRGVLDGQPRTDNELEDILKSTTDSERAHAAWLARKQIGAVVAADVRALARLRNEAARANGFATFWHQQMLLEELDPAWMEQVLADVERASDAPFGAMKADLDRHLAERFSLASVADLRPWHYGDPFFQETPDVFAPSSDPLYAERDIVAVSAETYRQLGFDNIDAILGRSDLFPREAKNQHAYSLDIDREGDVRTFLNVEHNARWMGTLLHELGHAIYQDGVDRKTLPWDLRDDPQGFLNEGFAMFCEQPMFEPAWLADLLQVPPAEAEQLAPRLVAQERSALLAFLRWCLVIVHFERRLYEDPEQDLNRLWWDLVERYQQVPRPEGRDEPDWATKIHVATSPVYYHKYMLGRMFAAQLAEQMQHTLGGWWGGRPASGVYVLRELFMPGATYHWSVLIERVTGAPLGVEALARAVTWQPATLSAK